MTFTQADEVTGGSQTDLLTGGAETPPEPQRSCLPSTATWVGRLGKACRRRTAPPRCRALAGTARASSRPPLAGTARGWCRGRCGRVAVGSPPAGWPRIPSWRGLPHSCSPRQCQPLCRRAPTPGTCDQKWTLMWIGRCAVGTGQGQGAWGVHLRLGGHAGVVLAVGYHEPALGTAGLCHALILCKRPTSHTW